MITDGISYLLNEASLLWLILMGVLYITGAVLYATRTPERCFPGKCDLWVRLFFCIYYAELISGYRSPFFFHYDVLLFCLLEIAEILDLNLISEFGVLV